MRSIKVGETTYLASSAASASNLLDLESEEFWDGVTREEYVELNKLVREIGTMPRGTTPLLLVVRLCLIGRVVG